MPVIRLLVLILTTGLSVIAVIVGVALLLGVAWLAVALPVLVVAGVVAAGRALWRRGRSPDGSQE